MEYYKKYRIIQNVRLAEGVNHIINFFHKLPIIRKFTKDKYKWYGLKRFVFLLGPLFSLLGQFIKSFISLAMAMWISGALIKLTNIPWNFENGLFDGLYDLGMNSLAFLAIYLTGAILSNAVIDAKQVIRELNLKLRMNPKATGLSLAVFDPLRVAIARGFAFSIILGFKNGFLVSFILLFIRLIANSVNLNLYRKLGKNVGDNFLLIIAVFVISFFIFKYLKLPTTSILLIIFIIGLIGSIFSVKYLFVYDGYGQIIEIAKRESTDISTDFDQISNDSLALKEGDLNTNSKAKGTGYEFLNNLFFERHRRLIVKPIFKRAAVIAAIMLAGFLFMKFKHQALSWNVNKYITIILAELVFIMFNNESVSRAMFLNCDRPLMRYGFYKNKAAVFDMYKLRYMSFLKLNIPGLLAALVVFGIGYSLFKEITMAEMLVYVLFIIACYIFYPAFNLGNYYICQPYNSDAKNVGLAYKWVSAILSYVNILFIPLFIIKEVADGIYILKIYAIIMTLLTILYFVIVKYEGDKTFRIKQ